MLFVGTLAGNLLGYLFFVVLSRTLSPQDLGAVGSLASLATIAAVPGLGIQLVAARWVATPTSDSAEVADGADAALAAGLRLALLLSAGALVLAPGAAYLLRVGKAEDGTYRARMMRPDGTMIVVKIDATFAVTSVDNAPDKVRPGPHKPGNGATSTASPSATS